MIIVLDIAMLCGFFVWIVVDIVRIRRVGRSERRCEHIYKKMTRSTTLVINGDKCMIVFLRCGGCSHVEAMLTNGIDFVKYDADKVERTLKNVANDGMQIH
ncbi:MAG: hypothetical protein UY96_C0010G0025 [Parcubacteria group bacterium GW2011_GWB1_56_8]|nr:MAG: hypothetical protein UY96_C0010G0025 [Parcubacteria group bacterium GW2011_GWB1_56_8]